MDSTDFVQVKYMFLDSNENDLEIFGFYLIFNIDFWTLFEITLLNIFLSSFRYEKIEKKNSKLKFKVGMAWIFLVFHKDIFILINKIYTFCIFSESWCQWIVCQWMVYQWMVYQWIVCQWIVADRFFRQNFLKFFKDYYQISIENYLNFMISVIN